MSSTTTTPPSFENIKPNDISMPLYKPDSNKKLMISIIVISILLFIVISFAIYRVLKKGSTVAPPQLPKQGQQQMKQAPQLPKQGQQQMKQAPPPPSAVVSSTTVQQKVSPPSSTFQLRQGNKQTTTTSVHQIKKQSVAGITQKRIPTISNLIKTRDGGRTSMRQQVLSVNNPNKMIVKPPGKFVV